LIINIRNEMIKLYKLNLARSDAEGNGRRGRIIKNQNKRTLKL